MLPLRIPLDVSVVPSGMDVAEYVMLESDVAGVMFNVNPRVFVHGPNMLVGPHTGNGEYVIPNGTNASLPSDRVVVKVYDPEGLDGSVTCSRVEFTYDTADA